MSNIYIQEPPTSGKVLLKTSAGDIDVELWCREAPKTCRNFIQLCMEGYYNGTIFHRVVKGFIAQGGDPNGDGTGGESIYGAPFKDEFHSRLRFSRRGLIASANSGRDDNGSQFFFTLAEAPELQNKHTIFGKITGDTIFNMLKLEGGEIDANERPHYPYKINKTEVLLNPFDDIVPRKTSTSKDRHGEKSKKKKKEKGIKNFGLLSFGVEAEVDEEETDSFVQKNAGKSKSTHDILDDPKLSKQTLAIGKQTGNDARFDENVQDPDAHIALELKAEEIRNKLKVGPKVEKPKNTIDKTAEKESVNSDSDDLSNELERERKVKRQKKAEEIRNEIKALKKEYKADKKPKEELDSKAKSTSNEKEHQNEMVRKYLSEQKKYSNLKKDVPQKGGDREKYTLQLLNKFKAKLENIRSSTVDDDDDNDNDKERKFKDDIDESELNSDKWLSHTLCFEEKGAIVAKDASTKRDDWHDIYDPRNPINKRKRGEDRHRDRDNRDRHRSSSQRDRK